MCRLTSVLSIFFRRLFYQWQRNDKSGAFAEFTFHRYVSSEECYHFLHICESQSESFDIMTVACGNPEEFVENSFKVIFLDADAIVFDSDFKHIAGNVFGCYLEHRFTFLIHVFDSIVKKIEYHISELHLVNTTNALSASSSEVSEPPYFSTFILNVFITLAMIEFASTSVNFRAEPVLSNTDICSTFSTLKTKSFGFFCYYLRKMLQGGG